MELKPTSTKVKIYNYLTENINRPISHNELINVVYDKIYNQTTQQRVIDVYISRIKNELSKEGLILYRNHKEGYFLTNTLIHNE